MFALDEAQPRRVHQASFAPLTCCVFALVCATSGYAQTAASPVDAAAAMPSSSMSAATAAEVQKISENMTILQAQLNQLELKTKIATKQRELTAQGASDGFVSSFGRKAGNPSVVSVAGLVGSLEAVLVFPGGVTQRVKVGDVIEDRRVSRIAVNEVVLTDLKGKNIQRLAFGASATTREAGSPTPGIGSTSFPPVGMPAVPLTR